MKYPKIAASLGWTETPDLQEGLHLQPEEAAKIDEILSGNETALTQATEAHTQKVTELTGQVTSANNKVTELEGQVATATAEKTTISEKLAEKETALTAANARIAELEAMEGKGSATVADEDPKGPANKVGAMDYDFQKELLSQV
jgi:TolA-binding protein